MGLKSGVDPLMMRRQKETNNKNNKQVKNEERPGWLDRSRFNENTKPEKETKKLKLWERNPTKLNTIKD